MKKEVYVFGCGNFFHNKQFDILEKYNIIAILDNKRRGKIELLNGEVIPIIKPVEAVKNMNVPIIIMAYDFYSVWKELESLSIDSSRIIFPNVFLPFTNDEQMIDLDKGKFCIVRGNIYYVNARDRYIIDSTDAIHMLSMLLERSYRDASFITSEAPTEPLNRKFGFTRGTPVDRYYIEKWLELNKKIVRGDVLEIAEDTYTKRYGDESVVPHILYVDREKEGGIKGNLETGEGISENSMDCIILTQTLPVIYKCENVISNLYKMLRAGGHALITTSGISQISRYDMERWGHFWSFTTASLKRLIEESAFGKNYEITVYGNVKTACALLYGMAAEELKEEELLYVDEDYPVSICAIVTK